MNRRELLKNLYEKERVILTQETLKNYTRGFKTLRRGIRHYFSFYPEILPHEKDRDGKNNYNYEEVIAWLRKFRRSFYWRTNSSH